MKVGILKIHGDISYSNSQNIHTNLLIPNIMGPFSYIPFMECNHAILSMKNKTNGELNINEEKIIFNNDIGYIEKDWGYSFPKSYIWCQANNFQNKNASFILSIADIPFKVFDFKGIICSLIVDNTEYKFNTYNNTKIIQYDIDNNSVNITIKKRKLYLNIKSTYKLGHELTAPVKGKMEKNIIETICATTTITLKKNSKTIFSDTSTNCGLEIVK